MSLECPDYTMDPYRGDRDTGHGKREPPKWTNSTAAPMHLGLSHEFKRLALLRKSSSGRILAVAFDKLRRSLGGPAYTRSVTESKSV